MIDTDKDQFCPECKSLLEPHRKGGEEGTGPWHYTCTNEECDFSAFDYELEEKEKM